MPPRKRTTPTEAAPPVVVNNTVVEKVEPTDYYVFVRSQAPDGTSRAKAKLYGPVDRSTANSRLQREKRAHVKAYGTDNGFAGHTLLPSAMPADTLVKS